MKKTLLSIVFVILMIAVMVPAAFATGDCTTHEYGWVENSASKGVIGTCRICQEKAVVVNLYNWDKIKIDSDGYSINNKTKVPF
ncbi:MAG: hypothetical protein IKV21_01485, partial [Clostridia bacterium]|nr:hypothetical protein [Clostridia bacterium]